MTSNKLMGMGGDMWYVGLVLSRIQKTTRVKVKGRSKSNFQTRNEIRSCDLKIEKKNYEQQHEMCKRNVKMDIYYAKICKYEHENNMTIL
jgi:hypothetical protein